MQRQLIVYSKNSKDVKLFRFCVLLQVTNSLSLSLSIVDSKDSNHVIYFLPVSFLLSTTLIKLYIMLYFLITYGVLLCMVKYWPLLVPYTQKGSLGGIQEQHPRIRLQKLKNNTNNYKVCNVY